MNYRESTKVSTPAKGIALLRDGEFPIVRWKSWRNRDVLAVKTERVRIEYGKESPVWADPSSGKLFDSEKSRRAEGVYATLKALGDYPL